MVNPAFAGRTYPPTGVYEVSREKIREFAQATGAHPAHLDPAAAQALGHADVIAPPTFAVIVSQRAEQQLIDDPQAQIDFSRVVHGEQTFVHHRPIVAGDRLVSVLHVDAVRAAGGHSMVTTRTEIAAEGGEAVCTSTSTLVVRGADT